MNIKNMITKLGNEGTSKPLGPVGKAINILIRVVGEAQKQGKGDAESIKSMHILLDHTKVVHSALQKAVDYVNFMESCPEATQTNMDKALRLVAGFKLAAVKARMGQKISWEGLEGLKSTPPEASGRA